MRYDQKPVHRKLIIPWYDSNTVCIVLLLLVLLVFIFSIIGIIVSSENGYQHIWMPLILAGLSCLTVVLTTSRIIKRLKYRWTNHTGL